MNKTSDFNDFTIVIPVHNEAKMLRYTLPSIYKLKPAEVIFVLDRCTDSTDRIIKSFWKKHNSGDISLVLLRIKKMSAWTKHLNFLYDFGIRRASSKVVLLSQADVLHDCTTIRRNIASALRGMVSFAVSPHPHIAPWNHFVSKTLQTTGNIFGVQLFSGVIAFSSDYYLTCPLTANDRFSFDTQLLMNFKGKKYPYKYVQSRNLNLRPWVRSKLWSLGIVKFKAGKSLWKVLLFSMFRLMPEVLAGFLYAKFTNDLQKL